MYTATTQRKWLHRRGHFAHFQDRQKMKLGHPQRKFSLPAGPLPPISLPIDWAKNLQFPMYGNDQYGDCMEAAAAHADNTFTGNTGSEVVFDGNALVQQYLAASGGDNGLDEKALLDQCWKPGIGGVKDATYLDALDIDPTNPQLVQFALANFGAVVFMLDVPDDWLNSFNTGAVWNAPAAADQNNGHGVLWNGVDADGNYKIQTWGTFCWITPAGVTVCDPSAFVVFSLRWFNAQGLAPNGKTYDQLAALWVQCGGNPLPTNPFVNNPPAPTPAPSPTPPAPTLDPLEQFVQQIFDEWFSNMIAAASKGGDNAEALALTIGKNFADATLPILFGDLESALGNLQKAVQKDQFLSVMYPKMEARIRTHFSQQPVFGMLKRGVSLAHVHALYKTLPPGTLATILQDVIQYGPQIVQLVLTVVQAIKSGNIAA